MVRVRSHMVDVRRCLLVALVLLASCSSNGAGEPSTTTGLLSELTTLGVGSTSTSEPRVTTTSLAVATTLTLVADTESISIGPLEPRGGHSVIWTGKELIVWGGEGNELGSVLFADGAAYNPATETWRVIAEAPLSPRRNHVAAWTGEEMLIVGGVGHTDGARYSPSSDTWETMSDSPIPVGPPSGAPIEGFTGSVWTGEELMVWHVKSDEVAVYDQERDQWTLLPPTGLQADNGSLRWSGDHVYAFGSETTTVTEGFDLLVARFTSGRWEQMPSAQFSTDEYNIGADPTLVEWAGDRFVAWSDSGREGRTLTLYPDDETWTDTSRNTDPPCEGQGEPIRADSNVISFGWCGPNASIYDSDTGIWNPFPVTGFPTARYTVWTGIEVINWGDTCCYGSGGQPFTVAAWRTRP